MSTLTLRSRNDFLQGWVAYVLGQPTREDRSELWRDGWMMGHETVHGVNVPRAKQPEPLGPGAPAWAVGRLYLALLGEIHKGNLAVEEGPGPDCSKCGDSGMVVVFGGDEFSLVSKPCECPIGCVRARQAAL